MGVWDGLDECEISRPDILSQSAPDGKHVQYVLYNISILLFTIIDSRFKIFICHIHNYIESI